MGRGQTGCAEETRLGPDGVLYRRGRRRAVAIDRASLEYGVIERYRRLLNDKLLDAPKSRAQMNELMQNLTVALQPEEVEQILDTGDREVLALIPSGVSWQMDLTRFGDFPSVTFIGEGALDLAVGTDTAGTGYRVEDRLAVKLRQGHVYADDQVTIDLIGKAIVSSFQGSPQITTSHEWALVQADGPAHVTVHDSFQVWLASSAVASLDESSRGQMILMDGARLEGAHSFTADELLAAGHSRHNELQLADGLTASCHEWVHRQN